MLPRGIRCCRHSLGTKNASSGTSCEAGSIVLSPVTSVRFICIFRVLLLRRLRVPLPLAAARCRCSRCQDELGDHLAVCPRSGVRGAPLERAAARVCREPGATNILVRDLNVIPSGQDDRA